MATVTGIFASQADAERAARALVSRLGRDRVTILMPGEPRDPARSVDVVAAEQPGMGKVIGGVVGASVGVAGGLELGAALTAAVPGVGPVIALGLLGGALLGLAGAEAGGALENAATDGLPEDEFFVYEDALRRGRSVLVASPEDEAAAAFVRNLLKEEGAKAVDAAREEWWIGLRSAEREHYSATGDKFDRDERFYRLGFEAALHARNRCKEYDQVLAEMQADLEDLQRRYPGADLKKPFQRGFERGLNHYQRLCEKSTKPAGQ